MFLQCSLAPGSLGPVGPVGPPLVLQCSLAPGPLGPVGPRFVPCDVGEEMVVMGVDLWEGMSLWFPVDRGGCGEGMFLPGPLGPVGPPLVPCGVWEEMKVGLGGGVFLWSPVAFGPPFLL